MSDWQVRVSYHEFIPFPVLIWPNNPQIRDVNHESRLKMLQICYCKANVSSNKKRQEKLFKQTDTPGDFYMLSISGQMQMTYI